MSAPFRPTGRRGSNGGGWGASFMAPKIERFPAKFKTGGQALVQGATVLCLYPFTQPSVLEINGDQLTLKQGNEGPVTITIKQKESGREYAKLKQSGVEKNRTFTVVPFNPDGEK